MMVERSSDPLDELDEDVPSRLETALVELELSSEDSVVSVELLELVVPSMMSMRLVAALELLLEDELLLEPPESSE
jgi:hypothetical protein